MSIRSEALARTLLVLATLAIPATGMVETPAPIDRGDTIQVEIAVQVRSGFGRLPILPGITLAIGVGQEADEPLHLERPVLRRISTDDEGFARATIELPRAMALLDGARMWARVEAEGYARTVRSFPIASHSVESPVYLRARPGRFFRGRVLTQSGVPVKGARVWLIDPKNGQGPDALSDENGHFLVRYEAAGKYDVHVRSAHPGQPHGTGSLGPLELDLHAAHDLVEVEIQGRPAVTGRIIDPAGEPVRGAYLLALPQGRSAFPSPGACMRAERGGSGLLGGLARTDGDGRFELPGLVDGNYDLHAALSCAWDRQYAEDGKRADGFHVESFGIKEDEWFHPDSARATMVGTLRVGSDTGDLELVFPVQRVEVRVTDASGASPDPFERDTDGGRAASRLSIMSMTDGYWYAPRYPVEVDDLHVFPVPVAGDYAVSWTELEIPYAEERATVGTWHTRVDLRLGNRADPANLTIRILGPSGQLLPEDSQVEILSADNRRQVETSVESGYGAYSLVSNSLWTVELPAGRFIVRATAEALMGCVVPDPYPRPTRVPAERVIELQPGEEAQIDIQLGSAGFLDMLSLEAPAGLLPHEKKRYPVEELDPADIRSQLGGGVAYLSAPGRERIGPLSFESLTCSWADWEWIKPGWTSRCMSPLPPGTWTLEVHGDEGLLFRREIVIEEGSTTTVEW